MSIIQLEDALNNSKSFYKSEKMQFLIALYEGEKCFKYFCYNMECGCKAADSCDLEEGETVTSLYSDALEISQEKFINEWKECFKNLS